MAIKFSNLASTTLASGVSSSATSISVTSASSFPSLGGGDYFYASIGIGSGSEVVKVTAVSGTTFTVVRGQDDTTAISHASDVEVALRVTAASLNDLSTQADTESVSRAGDSMTGDLSVAGEITADGLTVDGASEIRSTFDATLNITSTAFTVNSGDVYGSLNFVTEDGSVANDRKNAATIQAINAGGSGSYCDLDFYTSAGTGAANSKSLKIAHNGDISFYNQSGTSQALFWDASAESLGIGTSSPTSKLHVSDATTSAYKALTVESTHSTSDAGILLTGGGGNQFGLQQPSNSAGLFFYDRTNSAERMRIDSSGRVGIGTSSPSAKLSIYDASSANSTGLVISNGFTTDTAGDSTEIMFQHYRSYSPSVTDSAFIKAVKEQAWDETGDRDSALVFGTRDGVSEPAERLRIDSSGRVGIGTSSPSRKLTVQGGSGDNLPVRVVGGSGTTKAHMEFQDSSTTADYKVTLGSVGDALSFQSGGTERMRIDSSGRVGIGESSPDQKLHVSQAINNGFATVKIENSFGSLTAIGTGSSLQFSGWDAGVTANIKSVRTGSSYSPSALTFETFGGAGTTGSNTLAERMRIDEFGNVGIGGSALSGNKLDVIVNTDTAADTHFRVADKSSGVQGGVALIGDMGSNENHGLWLRKGYNGDVSVTDLVSEGSVRIFTGSGTAEERMRIDASGNLLVGTTDTTLYNNTSGSGINLNGSGRIDVTRGDVCLNLNRNTSNGSIIELRKDGTAVGSIGASSPALFIGSGDVGIRFDGGNDRIRPVGNASNLEAVRNGAIDLGDSGARFKDLYLSGTVNTEAVSTNSLDLQAIAESKSVTAKDVFVYDTSKDSDGGAWRHRTQGTSWYNETLNTSTRGATKKFPAVAVIAFNTSNEMFIYNGDEPDLPLWAKYSSFTQDKGFKASLTAVNGTIYAIQRNVTAGYSGNGHFQLNFVADYFFSNILSVFSTYRQGRADGLLTSYDFRVRGDRTTPKYALVNYEVNDIAVTVLPNAPIDADTGLPVPTIAVATNGGVSVIKDDGTVVDLKDNAGGDSTKVMFTQDGKLAYAHDGATSIRIDSIPSADFTYGSNKVSRGSSEEFYINSGLVSSGWGGDTPVILSGSFSHKGLIVKSDSKFGLAQTGSKGLTLLDRSLGKDGRDKNMVAYTSSDYNTGWMNGDIKLATLSDTDTADVAGSELVTNGTFASNANSWTTNNGSSIAWNGSSDQTATVTSGGSVAWNGATQLITGLTVGKTYVATADIITSNNWGAFGFAAGANSGNRLGSYTAWNSGSPFPLKGRAQFVATATSHVLSIDSLNTTNATVTKVDNVSVRIAEEDRSVNNNGLQVFGTVTKTAVATGADLVVYSGFSASNYLQQPYNSDLDFSAGSDFSIIFWNNPSSVGDSSILYRGDNSLSTNSPANGFNIWTYDRQIKALWNGVGIYADPTTSGLHNKWSHCVFVCRGGIGRWYINGVANSLSGTVPAISGGDLFVGEGYYTNNATRLALLRISATAPTAEQIAKMYRDEKPLFQEGAQATLYGTSDAVTALAYDDDTELLHAGTSAGRSVFQGLRRVDNTTDAVGAAISASNDLVVEE